MNRGEAGGRGEKRKANLARGEKKACRGKRDGGREGKAAKAKDRECTRRRKKRRIVSASIESQG